jgi:thiol-disulfide isomerase/thioredoxin
MLRGWFILLLTAFFCLGIAEARAQEKPVKLVFFTADWCPNCNVLAPRLAQASANLDGVERIDIDITNAQRWDASLERALDRRVVRLYNAYVGTTGFAVIAAGDTGETIACVNASFEAATIEIMLRRAIERVGATPPHQRAQRAQRACPAERAQPPPG